MSRLRTAFMAAAIMLTMVITSTPSLAQNNPAKDPLVFGPDPTNPGQGDTFSCTGAPPFNVPSPPGNCRFVGFGPSPAGLVCDIPTTVFFTSSPGRSEPAFICHAPKKHHHKRHHSSHKHHSPSQEHHGGGGITQNSGQEVNSSKSTQSSTVA
jgi:hypothetical protein